MRLIVSQAVVSIHIVDLVFSSDTDTLRPLSITQNLVAKVNNARRFPTMALPSPQVAYRN